MNETKFPVSLEIDYPDRELNRLTTFFRCIMLIPPVVILALLTGPGAWGDSLWRLFFASGAILFAPTLLMILFRRKYPRWWFDWNVNITKFSARVGAYAALLTDEFPSTEREQSVHIDIPFPDVKKDLRRGMPLVKWFLAIPHWFHPVLPGHRGGVLRVHLLVRDPVHRPLPEVILRFRGGCGPLGPAGRARTPCCS